MSMRRIRRVLFTVMLAVVPALVPVTAQERATSSYPFTTPVFGIDTALDGSLLVADAGAGIVRLRRNVGALIAAFRA